MNIEPTGVHELGFRSDSIISLGVKASERYSRGIVPPMCARKIFHQLERFFGSASFASEFRFVANQLPHARMDRARAIEDFESAFIIACSMPHRGQINGRDPRSRIFF